jgi:hypothetical protein
MRVVGEIPHPDCKITLLSWNNRYLIKIEQGLFEQTYKINIADLSSDSELMEMVDEQFVRECVDRFPKMHESLASAMSRL